MLPTNAKLQILPQRCIVAPATRIEPADNHLAPKTSTNHLTMRPAAEERMTAMLGDDRPTPPPTHCARVADAPTPQPARDCPPWHPGILPNETSMPTAHHATPATRDDVPARMSGTGQAESPLGSCRAGLEHPSMSSNTSTKLVGMRQVVHSKLQPGSQRSAPCVHSEFRLSTPNGRRAVTRR